MSTLVGVLTVSDVLRASSWSFTFLTALRNLITLTLVSGFQPENFSGEAAGDVCCLSGVVLADVMISKFEDSLDYRGEPTGLGLTELALVVEAGRLNENVSRLVRNL